MNPMDFFANAIPRPPLPGEVWNFTADEAHCFSMEVSRLSGFFDEEASAPSHWRGVITQAMQSHRVATNSTAELFAYAEAFVAAARVHAWSLRPEDPEVWKQILSDPLMRSEAGVSEEEAQKRFEDAAEGIVRLPCEHTASEHQKIMLEWYTRNMEATKFRRVTLYRVWELPGAETLFGKQFIARHDMDREIDEQIDVLNQNAAKYMDPETDKQLVTDCGMTPDESDAVLEVMRKNRTRDAREQLLKLYEQNFRILD